MIERCIKVQKHGFFCGRPARFAVTLYGQTKCYCGYHVRSFRLGHWKSPPDIRSLGKLGEHG